MGLFREPGAGSGPRLVLFSFDVADLLESCGSWFDEAVIMLFPCLF